MLNNLERIQDDLFAQNIYHADATEYWKPGLNGDCEDYAMLLITLWLEAGIEKHDCGIAFVKMNDTKNGHAVAWVNRNGLRWADCNSPWVHSMDKDDFEWVSYMRMSDPTNWFAFEDKD